MQTVFLMGFVFSHIALKNNLVVFNQGFMFMVLEIIISFGNIVLIKLFAVWPSGKQDYCFFTDLDFSVLLGPEYNLG